jgi:hydrogenase/urease accessory protein HupE
MSPGFAHIVIEGAGDLVNGAVHPFVTPVHGMILLGLGLLAALQEPLELKWLVRILAPLSAVALGLTHWISLPQGSPVLPVLALGVGAAVAQDRKWPRVVFLGLAALVAVGLGLNSPVVSSSPMAVAKTLLGTWVAVNVVVLYIAASGGRVADRKWVRTAMRILGSWIVAISLLVLAFALRKVR